MLSHLRFPALASLPSAIILGITILWAIWRLMVPPTYTPPQIILTPKPSEAVAELCFLSQDLANYFLLNAAAFQPDGQIDNNRDQQQEPTLFSILGLDPFSAPFDKPEKACDNNGPHGKQIMEIVFRAGNIVTGRESFHDWENERTFAILVQRAMYRLIKEDTRCIYMDWLERKDNWSLTLLQMQANDGFHHVGWKKKCKGILPNP